MSSSECSSGFRLPQRAANVSVETSICRLLIENAPEDFELTLTMNLCQ